MNAMIVFPIIENNKSTSSTYILESFNVWHGRLCHVNYNTLDRLINLNLLFNRNCEICVEAKMARACFIQLKEALNL